MALPLLNDSPKYELTIPSTKEKIRFRPFLVKEQKVLLLASESNDKNQILRAMLDTIESCAPGVNVYNLAIFDVDYIFTQIRAKSVGEKIELDFECTECRAVNRATVDIESISLEVPEKEDVIELTDDISIKMSYPNYSRFLQSNIFNSDTKTDIIMEVILCSIDSIMTKDENIKASDESRESLMAFVESMTSDQFDKISSFIQDMPTLKEEIKFNCINCGIENKSTLEGIDDFF